VKRLVFLVIAATTVSGFAVAKAPQSTKPAAFKLTVSVSEPFIKKGKLGLEVIKKSFVLDASAVARSQKFGQLSSNLSPKLEGIFKALTREGKDARFNLEKGSWIARQFTSKIHLKHQVTRVYPELEIGHDQCCRVYGAVTKIIHGSSCISSIGF
jgi:vancomycin resistance protein YoaR